MSRDIGTSSESRFFEAFGPDCPLPTWVSGIRQASDILDIHGIDAIAEVMYYQPRQELALVPIQVLHSGRDISAYYGNHPYAKTIGVVLVVVKPWDSIGKIRQRVYSQLGEVRRRGTRFEEYLENLERKPITGNALRYLESVRMRRAARVAAE